MVEVLLPAAHPAHVEGGVRPDRVGTGPGIGPDHQRNAGHHVEPVQRLAGPGPSRGQQAKLLGGEARGEEDRQPAVDQLPCQLQVPRADGGQVGRDVIADRRDGQLQRLAGTAGQGQLVVVPGERHGLPGQCPVDHLQVLAGPGQRLVEPDPVPALGDLRARHTEPEPEPAAGQHVQAGGGHRGHGRGPGRDLHHRRPEIDGGRLTRQPGQHRRAVRAVGLRRPHHCEAQRLGVPGQPQLAALDHRTRPDIRGSGRGASRHRNPYADPREPRRSPRVSPWRRAWSDPAACGSPGSGSAR